MLAGFLLAIFSIDTTAAQTTKGIVSLSTTSATITEGEAITITITATPSKAGSVGYSVFGINTQPGSGSADKNTDITVLASGVSADDLTATSTATEGRIYFTCPSDPCASSASHTIKISALWDLSSESNEALQLWLHDASGDLEVAGDQSASTFITIQNKQSPITVNATEDSLANGDTGEEGWESESNEQAKNTARLSFKVDFPSEQRNSQKTIDYVIKGVTAPGTRSVGLPDYNVAGGLSKSSGTLTVLSGQSSATLWIDPIDDTLAEPAESFEVIFSNPSNGMEFPDLDGNGSPDTRVLVIGTIYSEDTVEVTADSVSVEEGDNAEIQVTLERKLGAGEAVSVQVRVAHGNGCTNDREKIARTYVDYRFVEAAVLHFNPDEQTKIFVVPTFEDNLDEHDECVPVYLEAPQQALIVDDEGNPSMFVGLNFLQTSLTITDNDNRPELTVIPTSVQELDPVPPRRGSITNPNLSNAVSARAALRYTVTLNQPSGRTVTVEYRDPLNPDGNLPRATSGTDFVAFDKTTLTFTPGEVQQTVEVKVVDDYNEEPDEAVYLRFQNPKYARLIGATRQKLDIPAIIYNDDRNLKISVIADDFTVTEGASAVLRLGLSHPIPYNLHAKLVPVDGNAILGADYGDSLDLSGGYLFNIPAGDRSAVVTIPVFADSLDGEARETFSFELESLILRNPSDSTDITTESQLKEVFGENYRVTEIEGRTQIPTVTIIDGVALSVRPARKSVFEGQSVAIEAVLNQSAPSDVTFQWRTRDGGVGTESMHTAEADSDYTAQTAQSVTIPAGTTRVVLGSVQTLSDAMDESFQQFSVLLSQINGAAEDDIRAVVSILDDDPRPAISISDATATEGGDLSFTVSLSAASQRPVSVKWVTEDDTARSIVFENDYLAVEQFSTLSFAPGDTTKTIKVSTIDDSLPELNERFLVQLAHASNAKFADATAAGIITDDEMPEISIKDAAPVNEDPLNEDDRVFAEFVVTLIPAQSVPVTITYESKEGPGDSFYDAKNGGDARFGLNDFVLVQPTELTFSPGETEKRILIEIIDDTYVEATETFLLELSNPPDGYKLVRDTAFSAIIDGEASRLSVSTPFPSSVVEGDSGTTTYTAVLTRTVPYWDRVILPEEGYSVADAGAIVGFNLCALRRPQPNPSINPPPGTPITELSGSEFRYGHEDIKNLLGGCRYSEYEGGLGQFDPGQYSKDIHLTLGGDRVPEENERVVLWFRRGTYFGSSDITVDPTQVHFIFSTIVVDDERPQASIAGTSVYENEGNAELVVTLNKASSQSLTVTYETQPVDATPVADYTPVTGDVTFAPNETSKTISVPIAKSNGIEATETFKVLLKKKSMDVNVHPDHAEAIVTIRDISVPYLSIPDRVVDEGDTKQILFRLSDRQPNDGGRLVTLNWHDGSSALAQSATSGVDYQAFAGNASPGNISIAPGDINFSRTLTTIEDSIVEPDEDIGLTVAMSQSNNRNFSIIPTYFGRQHASDGSGRIPIITIRDDDEHAQITLTGYQNDSVRAGATWTSPTPVVTATGSYRIGFSLEGADAEDFVIDPDTGVVTLPPQSFKAPADADTDNVYAVTVRVVNEDGNTATQAFTVTVGSRSLILSKNSITVPEKNGSSTYTVVLNSKPVADVPVAIVTTGDTGAVKLDKSKLTFATDDWDTPQTITVTAVDDLLDNPDDRRSVTISHSASESGFEPSDTYEVAVTVTDDDAAPSVSVGDAVAVAEGNSTAVTTDMTFTVTLSAESGRDVIVDYSLGGSASAGSDYTAPNPLSVEIPAGKTTAEIVVAVKGDVVVEGDETVVVTLSSATNAVLAATDAAKTGTGTITNDDATPDVVLRRSTTVAEGATEAEKKILIEARLSSPVTFPTDTTVSVSVGKADDSAAVGDDYAAIEDFEIVIGAGFRRSPLKEIGFEPVDDLLDEIDEVVTVHGSSGTLNLIPMTITIIDDDATPSVSVGDAVAVAEGNSTAVTTDMTFTVTLSAESGRDVIVDYSLGGSASAGSDYTAPNPLSVEIPAGKTTAEIVVAVKGDVVVEGDETVVVTLSSATNAVLAATDAAKTGTGTITNDDATPDVVLRRSTTVAEGATEAEKKILIEARLSSPVTFPTDTTVSVSVGKADDSAAVGDDYAAIEDFEIVIGAGFRRSPLKEIGFEPVDDLLDEIDEVVTVHGSSGTLNLIPMTITIIDDDDAPSVSVGNAAAVTEGNTGSTDMKFIVTLSEVSGKDVTVNYGLTGTASKGDDYTEPSSLSVTIDAGDTTAEIVVAVKGDVVDEANETVIVTLANPTNAVLAAGAGKTGTGTITDDDASGVTITENGSPAGTEVSEDGGTDSYTVVLDSKPTADVTVTVTSGNEDALLLDGPDTPNPDNPTASEVLTFTSENWDTAQTIAVTGQDDALDNAGDERVVVVTHAIASDSDSAYNALADKTVTVTVTDNDGPPVVSIADATAVTEGNDPATTVDMTFTVSLSAVSGKPVTVNYALGGTAEAPGDYTVPDPLSVTIAAGDTTAEITIPVKGDVVDEPAETVIVTLSSASNASVSGVDGEDTGTGTITDDDATPQVNLVVAPASVAEGVSKAESVSVTASLSGTSVVFADATTVRVSVGKPADSARSGTDYTAVAAFDITIAAGDRSASGSFSFDPVDDLLDEPDESVTVHGSSAGLTVNDATVTITDDDGVPSVSVGDATAVTEGNDPATTVDMTFTVSLSAVSGKPVTVNYTLSGTASEPDDYTEPDPLSVTIPAGQLTGEITVAVKGDVVDEPAETVIVTLASATNASVSGVDGEDTGTGSITDDDATPQVNLVVAPTEVSEGVAEAESVVVTVSLSGTDVVFASATTVRVSVGKQGDSAKSGTDYTAVAAFDIEIAAGDRSATGSFSFDPTDDDLDEPDELVSVHGSSAGLTVNDATVTIGDDDGEPSVSVGDAAAVTEGNDPATTVDMTFMVSLSAVSGKPVTVNYTLSGTAEAPADYTAPNSLSVTIAAGDTTAEITIPVRGDVVDEANETVIVTLSGVTNAVLAATDAAKTGSGTITDDDATPEVNLVVAPTEVAEGVSKAESVSVTASLSGTYVVFADVRTVRVSVGKPADSAGLADYAAVSAFDIEIAAGDRSASGSFSFDPVDDLLDEPDEQVSVHGVSVGLTVNDATITITDDDGEPSVSVGDAAAVSEGNDPATTVDMTFTVSLSAVSGKPVTVTYTLSGTAEAPGDYTALNPLSVTIAAGDTTAEITIPVKGDVVDEPAETVIVTLSSASNASVSGVDGEDTGTGTITDDDATPEVNLVVAPTEVGEGVSEAESVRVTASLSGTSVVFPSATTVRVSVGKPADSAKSGTDYTAVAAFDIEIAAGARSASGSFSFDPADDDLDEPDESVTVHGSSAGLTVNDASVTITDDDGEPSVSVGDAAAVSEGNDPATTVDMTFTVSLSAVSGKPVTVTYTLSGTAEAPDDYTAPNPLSVTIAAGDTTAEITIPVKGDVVDEPAETVIVTLSSASNASVSGVDGEDTGTGTITDDDATPSVNLVVAPTEVAEGVSKAESVSVTASLSGTSVVFADATTVTVSVGQNTDSARSGVDYTAVAAFDVTIPAGDRSATGSFSFDPVDDDLDEPDEQVSVHGVSVGLTVNDATVTITDDDGEPSVSVGDATVAVTEGNDPKVTTNMVFTVTLSAVSGKPVTVTYTLSGTAEAPADYTAPNPLSVTIAAGDTTAEITVAVKGDVVDEANETVIVTLSGATNAVLAATDAAKSGSGSITDDDATPEVNLVVAPARVAEGVSKAESVVVTAFLSGTDVVFADVRTVTVSVGKPADSAGSGVDYTAVVAFDIEIPAGDRSASASFSFDPVDDLLDEPDEQVTVHGSSGSLTVNDASVTIADDDGEPSVSVGDATAVSEGNDPATTVDMTFTVSLSAVSGKPVAVNYSLSGTASEPADYTEPDPLSVTIAAGQMTGTITVPVKGDVVDEPAETIIVTLSGAANASVSGVDGEDTGTGSITDDDATPEVNLAVVPTEVAEGVAEAPSVRVTASLSGTSVVFADATTVRVSVGKPADSASSADYAAVSAFDIEIAAGDRSASGSFSFDPVDDDLDEPDEQVSVHGSSAGLTVNDATVTISDDDGEPSVSVGDAPSVSEGNDSATTVDMTFTVSLSAVSGKPVTVTYTLSGTAEAPGDYTEPDPLSVTIAAGDTTAEITVAVKGDVVDEPAETVIVTLSSATNASVSAVQGAASGTGTITDDDATPEVNLVVAPTEVAEGVSKAPSVRVTASLSGTDVVFADARTVRVSVGKP
ncbi:MAG: hypothetical protein OXE04_01230, partial [bacterium]|nr:hypothetical protein [bacterium]